MGPSTRLDTQTCTSPSPYQLAYIEAWYNVWTRIVSTSSATRRLRIVLTFLCRNRVIDLTGDDDENESIIAEMQTQVHLPQSFHGLPISTPARSLRATYSMRDPLLNHYTPSPLNSIPQARPITRILPPARRFPTPSSNDRPQPAKRRKISPDIRYSGSRSSTPQSVFKGGEHIGSIASPAHNSGALGASPSGTGEQGSVLLKTKQFEDVLKYQVFPHIHQRIALYSNYFNAAEKNKIGEWVGAVRICVPT